MLRILEYQIEPFVGWVEANPRNVGFCTSTQPTSLPQYGARQLLAETQQKRDLSLGFRTEKFRLKYF